MQPGVLSPSFARNDTIATWTSLTVFTDGRLDAHLSSSSLRHGGMNKGKERAPKGSVDVVMASRHPSFLAFVVSPPSTSMFSTLLESLVRFVGTSTDSPSNPVDTMRNPRPRGVATKGLCGRVRKGEEWELALVAFRTNSRNRVVAYLHRRTLHMRCKLRFIELEIEPAT